MSRWFRFYDDAVNDPKVQRLPGEKFKAWVNLLCIASKNGGVLPSPADITYILRISADKLSALLDEFCAAGLLDPIEVSDAPMSYEPHNWRGRQFKSDVSNDRVKRYRQRQRNVTVTPPDTEQKQITDTEQKEGGADAPAGTIVPLREYAWSGKIIRLSQQDYDGWRKAYGAIQDFDAELTAADDYYAANSPKDGKWFFPVSNWLKKAHQEALERRRKRVPRL